MPMHCPNLIREKKAFNVTTHTGYHLPFPHNQCLWLALISALAGMCKVQCLVRLQSLSLPSQPWKKRKNQTHLFAAFLSLNLTTSSGLPVVV